MIRLYDNAFSPFARKVRMVLEHKGLAHDVVDGLRHSTHDELARVNGRVEVPALLHDDRLVADLARTRAYLKSTIGDAYIERRRIFWRGDRIEWILARGFHRWFVGEIEADRVIWPGLGVPGRPG